MRRNFAQILKGAKVDIKAEYHKLYSILYDNRFQDQSGRWISMHDELGRWFLYYYFRGTCLTIEEFDDVHEFNFIREPQNFTIDNLIKICEYISNMLVTYQGANFPSVKLINVPFYMDQINRVIETVGYMESNQDGYIIYVEKSPAAIAVAESDFIPEDMSYKVISYNHYSMRGQIEEKKTCLLQLAAILEGKRPELRNADKVLESDLFFMFNNLNIRHNNIDRDQPSKYKAYVAEMGTDELENWYDDTYQMCLLAFLQIENAARKQNVEALKASIQISDGDN